MKKRITIILILCMVLQAFVPLAVNAESEVSAAFSDVSETAWYHDSVKYVSENGLMKGTSNNTFSPDMTLSRAMVATILYRMAGEPNVEGIENKFIDVQADKWYTSAILWTSENSIVMGRGSSIFDPNAVITRAELATMLFRYVANSNLVLEQSRDNHEFLDSSEIPDFARTAMNILYRAEIIMGKDGDLIDPLGEASRSEASALISRFVDNTHEQEFALLDKYSIEIAKSDIYLNYGIESFADIPAYKADHCVHIKFVTTDPTIYWAVDKLTLRITNGTNTVVFDDVSLYESKELIINHQYNSIESFEMKQLKLLPGEVVICEFTVTISGEAERYIIYRCVDTMSDSLV